MSITFVLDGQIVTVNFREGDPVRKGEVLFRIDPRPYDAALRQAEANALRDIAARDQARSQDRRYQELLEKNFVSKEAYAQIRTNAATAEATAKASEASSTTRSWSASSTHTWSVARPMSRSSISAEDTVSKNSNLSSPPGRQLRHE